MSLNHRSKQYKNLLSWAEIDLKALIHNLKELRRLAKRNLFVLPLRAKRFKQQSTMDLLTIIKADAYGHGMEKIGLLLQKKGVQFFGVSDVKEGLRLRKIGIKKSILLLESTLPCFVKDIIDNDLIATVCTFEMAKALDNYAQKVKKCAHIHIEVDTGMGRLGVWHENAFDLIKKMSCLSHVIIEGIFTHFPVADTNKVFTKGQIKVFSNLVKRLDEAGIIIPYLHAGNSMGLAGYQTTIFNLARPGLMLYGMYPSVSLKKAIRLRPVLTVRSKILLVKKIYQGNGISYGQTFIAKKDMRVAILPIGYSDGYFRAFSNKAVVIIKGKRCPVVGNVTMDQIMVDISKVKNVKDGMIATVLGKERNISVTADDLACYAKTINYEITCSLGTRLPRVFV